MFKKRIKVILWDFDGTIYHSEDSYREYAKCIESVMKNSDSFANKSMQVMEKKFDEVGSNVLEYRILRILAESGKKTMANLAGC